jgi:hypothetical protein
MMKRRFLPGALLVLAAACDGDRLPSGGARDGVTLKGRRIEVSLLTSEKERRGATGRLSAVGEERGHLLCWPRERFMKLEAVGLVPFDVAFLDRSGKILEVQPFLPPDAEGLMPKVEAAHALFLAPGLLKKVGAGPGDSVGLPAAAAAAEELPVLRLGGATAYVELALSDADKQHGLMFRPRMSADDGMLFAYDSENPRNFWMKNTLIPLDIAYFKEDGTFINLVETPTAKDPRRDDPPTAASQGPARFVLEMNLGWFKRKGLVDAQGNAMPGLKAVLPPQALKGSFD